MMAGAKRAADMRARAAAVAKKRADDMMTAVEITKAADSGTRRPRGRRPPQLPRVLTAMQADLENGFDLNRATEEEMKAKYAASRDVCRRARGKALSVEPLDN